MEVATKEITNFTLTVPNPKFWELRDRSLNLLGLAGGNMAGPRNIFQQIEMGYHMIFAVLGDGAAMKQIH